MCFNSYFLIAYARYWGTFIALAALCAILETRQLSVFSRLVSEARQASFHRYGEPKVICRHYIETIEIKFHVKLSICSSLITYDTMCFENFPIHYF